MSIKQLFGVFSFLIIFFITGFSVNADDVLDTEELILLYDALTTSPSATDQGVLYIEGKPYKVKLNSNQSFEVVEADANDLIIDHHTYVKPNCNEVELGFNVEWPLGAKLICNSNKDFLIAIYKKPEEDKILVQGYSKESNEPVLMKEISGAYFRSGYSKNKDYFYFCVSNDPWVSQYNKAHYLAVINLNEATISDMGVDISLSAEPVIGRYCGTVYFVGVDENLYEFDSEEGLIRMLWKNEENAEVVEIAMIDLKSSVSALKLRKNGKNYYKFFRENFFCEISTDYEITSLKFIDRNGLIARGEKDKYGRFIDLETLAFVTKEVNEAMPPKVFLRRWFSGLPPVFSTVQKTEEDKRLVSRLKEAVLKDSEIMCFIKEIKEPLFENEILLKDYGKIVDGYEFSKPFSITVINPKDGTEVPVNVWPPRNYGDGKLKPMIVWVHGGPRVHQDTDFDKPNFRKQVFASHDYWVIAPEARGSSGYGEAHEKALVNGWGQGHLDDIIAVAEYFKTLEEVDSNTIFLLGGSFGGYTTLAIATHSEYADYFTAYVPLAVLSNVGKSFHEQFKILQKAGYGKQEFFDALKSFIGFDPTTDWDKNEGNKQISPYYHLKNIKRPVFQIHGTNDTVTFPNQATDVHSMGYYLDLPIDTVMVEGMDHDFEGKNGYMGSVELPLEFLRKVRAGSYQSRINSKPHYVSDVEEFLKNLSSE